jgi:hypothetical protein
VSFVFPQIFALQRALKLSFLLIVLTTNFGDATKLLLSKFFSLKNVIGYLPNYFPPIL